MAEPSDYLHVDPCTLLRPAIDIAIRQDVRAACLHHQHCARRLARALDDVGPGVGLAAAAGDPGRDRPAPPPPGGLVIRRIYRPQLDWVLGRPKLVIGVALVLAAVAAAVAPTLGTEFLPTMDEGSVVVQPFQIPSVSLEQSLDVVRRIEQAIMELPEVCRVVSRTGRSDISSDPMGVGESDIYVVLAPRDEWTTAHTKEGMVEAIREKLASVPGVEFGYTQPIQIKEGFFSRGVQMLLGLLHDPDVRQNAQGLAGYDLSTSGQVIFKG